MLPMYYRFFPFGIRYGSFFDYTDGQMDDRLSSKRIRTFRLGKLKYRNQILLSNNRYNSPLSCFPWKVYVHNSFQIYANDKSSPSEMMQLVEVIDTVHAHVLQFHSPVSHLYLSLGALHINVQFSPYWFKGHACNI